jgi:hypothetical protein
MERKRVSCIGNCVERSREAQYNSTHLWVDIAKDVRDTFAGERDCLTRTRFVETEIEAPAIEKRKYVVEERIRVGELNDATHRYDLQVWDEHAILLQQGVVTCRWKWLYQCSSQWLEPDNRWNCALLARLG